MDLIRVRRGNVILDVPSIEKDSYTAQGYSVLDMNTNAVIEEAIPQDVGTLQALVGKLKAENEKLKAEIAKQAKEDISKLKKPEKPAKKETSKIEG